GMTMGNENGLDLGGIDAGRLHVGRELAGGGLHLSARAAVAHDGLSARLDHPHRERDRHKVGRQSRLHHPPLGVFDRGIGDECRIMRLFPDAVVERGDLYRAHLVSHESLGRIRGLLCEGRRDREPGIEAERGRHGGGNYEVATRQVEHGPSPREKIRRRRRLRRRSQDSGSGSFIPGAAPSAFLRSDMINDTLWGFEDLLPMFSLRWNAGVNNYMVYLTGDVPVGAYNPSRLSNVGIGHGAVDGGFGYTYLNPQTGHEFSGVLGFTYIVTNQQTQYQNGVDMHFDWGLSQFVTKQFQIGLVGYAYDEIGCDSGSGNRVGCFQSRVFGVGPQVGFIIPNEHHNSGLPEHQRVQGIRKPEPAGRLERMSHISTLTG